MKKKIILTGAISLPILLTLLIVFKIPHSKKKEVFYYNSYTLQKFDLKGPAKSVTIDQFYGLPTNNFGDNLFYKSGNRIVSFSLSGLINHQETESCIYKYNSNGQLIKKSFRNDKNIEYGYTNFSYSPNSYYKLKGTNYRIDKSQTYADTNIVVEDGTTDKYREAYLMEQMEALMQGKKVETRINFSDIAISRFYIMNNKGDVLEQFGRDVQYGYFKYKYDTMGRITYKYEGYQGITMNKDSILYTNSYDTVKITVYHFGRRGHFVNVYNQTFIKKNYDKYGNWRDLYSFGGNLILTRDIKYY